MADQLADILNRVNANPQTAAPTPIDAPSWAMKALNVLTQGQRTVANIGLSTLDAATLGPVRRDVARAIQGDTSFPDTRTYAGQLSRVPTDVAAGVVGFPNLPNAITEAVTGRDQSSWRIDSLSDATQAIHDKGEQVGEAIAGRPLNDSLLTGNTTDLGASWTRLLAGAALPVPGSWQSKMASGLQKVTAGNQTANTIATNAAKTLEVLTPLTLNPKAAAANIAVASTIAPALELAVGNHDQAIAQNQAGSEQAKGALDVAATGAKEVRDAKTVQANMLGLPEVDTQDAIIGASLLGAATLAQLKFNVAGRVLRGTKKALTSYDPANPLEQTEMPFSVLLKQQDTNSGAGAEEAFRRSLKSRNAPNIEQRATQFAESRAMRSGASVDTRMKQWYTDGTIPDSVHFTEPLNNYYARQGMLPIPEQNEVDRVLIATRERDTRRLNRGQAFDLFNTPTRDLDAIINAGMAKPAVKQQVDDYLAITRVAGNYMDEQARFTSAEIRDFRRKNPNFVATNIPEGTTWLSKRTPGQFTGVETFEAMGSPTKLLPQYLEEVVRSTEGKKIQREFFNELYYGKSQNDPYAQRTIGRTLTDAPPKESKDLFVHWRNGRGESRWTEVNDVAVRNSISGVTNPSALQVHKGFGAATKWYESGAFGTLAAVFGNVSALKSYAYARSFGSAFRPAGIAVSPLDKAVQELTSALTGGKYRIGMPEPFTALPQDLYNMVAGVNAVLWQRGAMALRNSVIRDGVMAKIYDGVRPYIPMGPATSQAAADAMATLYKNTGVAAMRADGLMGPGTFASVDPALSYRQAESVLRGHGLIGKLGEAGSFVGDILHAISSSTALTTKQLNKGADKAVLNNAIRNMSGDPGSSGAFRKATAPNLLEKLPSLVLNPSVINTIPWGNIFLQSGFRMISGAVKNPTGAAAGIMTTAVLPEMLGALWNASQGPEYTRYAYTERPPELQAGSFYIAIPGRDPAEGVEIAIDPWLRPFKHMAALLMNSHLGLLDGSFHSPDNELVQKAGSDSVKHRQMSFGEDSVPRAIAKQTLLPPVPGPVVAGAGLLGIQMRDWTEARPQQEKHNAGFTDGTGPKGSMFFEHYGMSFIDDLMKGIAAQAGASVYSMLDDTLTRRFGENYGRNEANQDLTKPEFPFVGEAIKQGITANVQMNLKKSGAMLGTASLFDNAQAISPSKEAAGVLVQDKLNGLRAISEGFKSGTRAGNPTDEVGTKKRGWTELAGVGPIAPQDQQMTFIAERAGQVYKELSTAYGGARKDLYAQRQSVSSSSKYSPQAKRYIMNEIADEIIQMDRKMLVDIERHEALISQQLGAPIKFDKINMNKDSKQFVK